MSETAENTATSNAVEDLADKEHAAAEQAISDAEKYANAAQQAGDAGEDAKPIQRTELTSEQRRELARKTAKRQRNLGQEELSRVYQGAIVVQRRIVVADPNIASSAIRFLGLVDRTYYLLNRFGLRYHTQSEVDVIRETLRSAVNAYCEEADSVMAQARELTHQAQQNTMDWLSPRYTSNTLEMDFDVKARDTMSLVRSLEVWDKAILEFAALEFNDTASIGQIDTMRQRERRLFMTVSKLCLRTIGGFSKRRVNLAGGKEADKQDATAPAETALA